jgi:hypothetical protein
MSAESTSSPAAGLRGMRRRAVATTELGDLIAVANMLVAHARRPSSGPRKLLVAIGEMVTGKAALA